MKFIKFLVLALCILSHELAFAQDDEAQLKELVKLDNQYFYELDFDAWTTNYVHDSVVYFSMATPNTVYAWVGWEQVRKGFKDNFDSREKDSSEGFTFEDLIIYIHQDVAWLSCTEKRNGNPLFRQHRFLRKVNDQWKTVGLSLVAAPR